MNTEFRQIGTSNGVAPRRTLSNVLGMLAGAVLLILGVMFSLLLLVIVVTAGLLGYSYLWWKTQAMRRQNGEQSQIQRQDNRVQDGFEANGLVVEGEIIRSDKNSSL